MSQVAPGGRVLITRPRHARMRFHFTRSHLWRLGMVFLMTALSVIGMWVGMVPASSVDAASVA